MKNDILTLTISALGSRGEGIARREDGYTLFIPGALPQDVVRALVVKENKSYGYAKLLNIISPSPHRVEPVCSVFGKCGGCSLLNASYSFQKELKRRTVKDALERIGGFKDIKVEECVGSDPYLGYRNKAQYPCVKTDKGVELGFYAPASHRVVPNTDCALQNPLIREIAGEIARWATEENISVYDEKTGKGCLRHVYVRTGKSEAIAVVVAAQRHKKADFLGKRLKDKFPAISGVVLNINSERTNTILGEEQEILFGTDYIIDTIGQIKYKINYKSFYQVNPYTTKLLYDNVLECCGLTGSETVYDLYCGGGTIGLYLAGRAKNVVGIEVVPEAVENAKENAKLNSIENARFYCAKAEELCPEMAKSGARADVIVLDPPRKGCEAALLEAAAQMEPKRIVYVSCNPSTMARDCALLSKMGYKIKCVTPFDQFPHCAHVECTVLLCREE